MQRLAHLFVTSIIVTVFSERFFWFWSTGVREHLEVAGFYALAVFSALWAIDRYAVDGWWSLLIATPLVGYVVEGVITPVMYTGGPFVPFFPVWFAAWHGILAMAIGVFAIRHWILHGRLIALGAAASALGVFWGVWASTLRTPAQTTDPELIAEHGTLVVLDPTEFALYALTFGAILIAAHWALGSVWPSHLSYPRWSRRLVGGLVLVGATAWTVVVPWALPMFVAYGWLQLVALRRHANARPPGLSLIAQLRGRPSLVHLFPLGLIVPTAALTYAGIWYLDPSDGVLDATFYSIIAVQTIGGAWLSIRAWRSAPRPAKPAGRRAPLAHGLSTARRATRMSSSSISVDQSPLSSSVARNSVASGPR